MTTGANAAYSSETVWNWGYDSNAGGYVGSSGGISSYYSIPSWQTNVSNMAGRGGSTSFRNIPDVALTADNVYVAYGNGTSGEFGGTSCAAPLWAGFIALVNQQAAANGESSVGFINPAIYAIAAGANYAVCFHDVTTGNNTWPSSPNLFYATNGYDLCTGLGTPNGTNLINALAPLTLPYFITQPSSQTVTNGASLTFGATVSWPVAVELPVAVQRHQSAGWRKYFRHHEQRVVHHGGDDQQLRQLQPDRHQQLRFRDQQRRGFDRRFCARVFCAAHQPDRFVRQQRRFQRDGQRLDAARLSMAKKRHQPCQRHRHLRRNQQCPHAHRRHDQQQRQLQFVRDEQLWRDAPAASPP